MMCVLTAFIGCGDGDDDWARFVQVETRCGDTLTMHDSADTLAPDSRDTVPQPVDECDYPSDCDDGLACTTDTCVGGRCLNRENCSVGYDCGSHGICVPTSPVGYCHPFAIIVKGRVKDQTGLAWYPAVGVETRKGLYPDGVHQARQGECSVVAYDFAPGQCWCNTVSGTVPCAEQPDSPDVIGCWHNMP